MSDRQRAVFALAAILAILLSVIDQYVVVTSALPILRDLNPDGGTSGLPWLLTSYTLASTAAMPLLGALCDSRGTKQVYLFSIWLFVMGSVLCGFATSLGELAAFRVLQGIGGGGLTSVTLVALGSVFPPQKRTGSGMGGGIVGLGIVLGPLIGGVLAEYASWRWVFWLNIPIALPVALMVKRSLHLPAPTHRRRVDLIGAGLITGGTCAFLLASQWAGTKYAWGSPVVVGLGVATVVLLGAFVLFQRSGRSAILPVHLFSVRMFRLGLPVQFLAGFSLLVAPAYVSVYLQIVAGASPSEAGLHTGVLAIGLFTAATIGGRFIRNGGGLRTVLLIDALIGAGSLGVYATLGEHAEFWRVWLGTGMLGVGLGGVLQVATLALQAHTSPDHIGTVTTNARFSALLGQSCGGALLGAIVNHQLQSTADVPGGRVDLNALPSLPPAVREPLLSGYVSGLHVAFLVAVGALTLAVLLIARMPNRPIAEIEPAVPDEG